jgi:hypothetical protein
MSDVRKQADITKNSLSVEPGEEEGSRQYSSASIDEYLIELARTPIQKHEGRAEEIVDSMRARSYYEKGKLVRVSMRSSYFHFKKFGHGFYFLMLLKIYFQVVFFLLGIIALPSIYYNIQGRGLERDPGSYKLLLTTLANTSNWFSVRVGLETLSEGESELTQTFFLTKNQEIAQHFHRHLVWDCVYVGILIASIYILRVVAYKQSLHVDSKVLSVSKYCLRVGNIPTETTRYELQDYLNLLFGEQIVDVNFSYKIRSVYKILKKISQITTEINFLIHQGKSIFKHDNHIAKLERQRAGEKDRLGWIMKQPGLLFEPTDMDLPKLEAFVIFENSLIPRIICKLIKRFKTAKFIAEMCEKNPDFKKFQNLKMNLPDDIMNINFQNFEVRKSQKVLRISVVFAAALMIMVVFIIAALFLDLGLSQNVRNFGCLKVMSYEAISKTPRESENFLQDYYCFCQNSNSQSRKKEIGRFCEDYVDITTSKNGLEVILVIFVMATNGILIIFVEKLVRFCKITSDSNGFAISIFLSAFVIFINTSLSFLLSSDLLLGGSITGALGGSDSYVRNPAIWLSKFSNRILLFGLLSAFLPQAWMILKSYCFRLINDFRAKNQAFQKDYLDLKSPAEFPQVSQYALLINLMLVTTVFSQMVPMANFLSLFSVITMYWCEKFTFLKFCRKAKIYSKLPCKIILGYVLPVSAVLRIICSVVVNALVFEFLAVDQLSNIENKNGLDFATSVQEAFNRSFPLIIILAGFILLIFAEKYLFNGFKKRRALKLLTESKLNMTYSSELDSLTTHSLPSYDFMLVPRYKWIFGSGISDEHADDLIDKTSILDNILITTPRRASEADSDDKINQDFDELLRKFSSAGSYTEIKEEKFSPFDQRPFKKDLSVIREEEEEGEQSVTRGDPPTLSVVTSQNSFYYEDHSPMRNAKRNEPSINNESNDSA